jgi:hypothetical protein
VPADVARDFTATGGVSHVNGIPQVERLDYNAESDRFTPGTLAGTPPQGNDAKRGLACHTVAKTRDYVFTEYEKR